MRAIVTKGFSERNGTTHVKGDTIDLDEAYVTTLVELGLVKLLEDDQPEASKANTRKRKASKKHARETI